MARPPERLLRAHVQPSWHFCFVEDHVVAIGVNTRVEGGKIPTVASSYLDLLKQQQDGNEDPNVLAIRYSCYPQP